MTSRRSIHSDRRDSDTLSPSFQPSVVTRTEFQRLQRDRSQDENNPTDDKNEVESEEEGEEYITDMTPAVEESSSEQEIEHMPECADGAPSPPSPRQNPQPQSTKAPTENINNINFKLYLLCAIILMFSVLVASSMFKKDPKLKTCRFQKLRQRPPLQSAEVWNALSINIELLLNKRITSPNIYLLLHLSGNSDQEIQNLIQDIALETSKCFDGKRPIEMSLQDFETKNGDDYGYPIEQYKTKLKEGNVFLIVNLNEIPPNAARALHTICETFSPIDPDVVIFLTLSTHFPLAGQSPTALADQTLRELWKQVPENELGPLITRVTDQVLLLQG